MALFLLAVFVFGPFMWSHCLPMGLGSAGPVNLSDICYVHDPDDPQANRDLVQECEVGCCTAASLAFDERLAGWEKAGLLARLTPLWAAPDFVATGYGPPQPLQPRAPPVLMI